MSIQNFSFRISLPKLICSLPVILVTLYFVPPIGIILTIARLFIYGSYRYYRVPAAILVVALLCLVPRAYELLQQNFGLNIPFLQFLVDFRLHPLYQKLTDFGRWVAIFSLIMFVVSLIYSEKSPQPSLARLEWLVWPVLNAQPIQISRASPTTIQLNIKPIKPLRTS